MINNHWQRQSPLACVYYFCRSITQLINHSLQILPLLLIAIYNSDNKTSLLLVLLTSTIVILSIIAILQFWFFRFQTSEQQIHLKQGIFKRQQRIISFDRVQNIDICIPFYFKPLNLAIVSLETAGSNHDEINLAAISCQQAQQLHQYIFHHQQLINSPNTQLASQSNTKLNQDQVIATASLKDLIYYGMTNERPLIIIAFLSPILSKLEQHSQQLNLQAIATNLTSKFGETSASILLITGLIISLIIFVQLFSILYAVIIHHNYRLTLTQHPTTAKLLNQGGLFTHYQKSLETTKIQTISIKASFLARLLGRANLFCLQIGNKLNSDNLIIPARTPSQASLLLRQLFTDHPTIYPDQSLSLYYCFNRGLKFIFIPSLLIFFSIFFKYQLLTALIFASLPWLLLPYVYLYWKNYKFAFQQGYALIHTGVLGYTRRILPLYKLQSIEISQTILQKRRNLCTLTLYFATGYHRIPFIPYPRARLYYEQCNLYVHTDSRLCY